MGAPLRSPVGYNRGMLRPQFTPRRLFFMAGCIALAGVELAAAPGYEYPLDLIFAAVFFAGGALASLFA